MTSNNCQLGMETLSPTALEELNPADNHLSMDLGSSPIAPSDQTPDPGVTQTVALRWRTG